MRILRTVEEVRADRKGRERVGLVPTMGAFHDGHLALIRRAREKCQTVYVSLFVNRAQFDRDEDYRSYPADEQRDFALAEELQVDGVFAPSFEHMQSHKTAAVPLPAAAQRWEGARRPGHFAGVTEIVAKLFDIFEPDTAFFGIKDLQQSAVIRQMLANSGSSVSLDLADTVREPSGLAMSSRNARLTADQRSRAAGLYETLNAVAASILAGGEPVADALANGIETLRLKGFETEYLAYVDPETMEPVSEFSSGMRIIVAANFHGVRLIDNVPV